MPDPKYGKVGLLLNGGGAKCIYQSGSVHAFVNHGVDYDCIYGSSGGALNGAMLHQGGLKQMRDLWLEIKTSDVYRWQLPDLLNPFTRKACVYDSSPLLQLIKRVINPDLLQRQDKQFFITATNYSTWTPLISAVTDLEPQEISQLLYASASPPVYFPLVPFRGQLLGDAGVVTNYNIAKAVSDGCDTLIVVGFAVPDPTVPRNLKDSLSETTAISMYGYFDRELEFVEQINNLIEHLPSGLYKPIKVVKIIHPNDLDLLDFDYTEDREDLWQSGYDLAAEILQKELPC